MVNNPKWVRSQSDWKRTLTDWVKAARPEQVMDIAILLTRMRWQEIVRCLRL